MAGNPIKHSDLVKDDGAIRATIEELEALGVAFEQAQAKIKGEAIKVEASIKATAGATKASNEETKKAATEADRLAKAQKALADAQKANAVELEKMKALQREQTQMNKLIAKLNESEAGSYNRLSAQYAINKIALNKMSEAQRYATESGRKLEKETNSLYTEMKRMQAATGQHQLNVGNYGEAVQEVSMNLGEMKRQLRDLRNVSFAGKSEEEITALNKKIGELTDNMADLKAQQDAYGMEFGAAIAGSLKVVSAGVEGLVGSLKILGVENDVLDRLEKQMVNLIAVTQALGAIEDAMQRRTLQTTAAKIKQMFVSAKDTVQKWANTTATAANAKAEAARAVITGKATLATKAAAIAQFIWNKAILANPILAILAGVAALTLGIIALTKSMGQNAKEARRLNIEIESLKGSYVSLESTQEFQLRLMKEQGKADLEIIQQQRKFTAERIAQLQAQYGKYVQLSAAGKLEEEQQSEMFALAKQINDLKNESIILSIQEKNAKADAAKAEKAKSDEEIKSLKEKTEAQKKEQAQREKEQQDANLKELEDYKALQLAHLQANRDTNSETFNQKLEADQKYFESEQTLEKKVLDLKLKYGRINAYEYQAALLLMQQASKEFAAEQEKQATEERQRMRQLRVDTLKKNYDADLKAFDLQQDLAESEFNLVKHTEDEKTKYKLQAEKDRLQKILDLNAAGNKQLSDQELAIIKNQIKAVDNAMADVGKDVKKKDIYEMAGIKLSDEQKEAISTSTSFAMDQLSQYLDKQVEMADRAKELRDSEVENAKSKLDQEIANRNAGYANNVETAQKQYDLALANQKKAEEEQKRALKRQQQIEAIQQAGNLITASAKIWSQLGFPWAIPALAIMWGSFIASKTKAAAATKAYGEGGMEDLVGGSHASGNDIDLGRTSDGKRRRAEGGEILGIIRKSRARQYKRDFAGVVDAMNRGTFEQRFIRADQLTMNQVNAVDTSRLEGDVKAIRRQGETRIYTDGQGNEVQIYKNLKRTILK